MRRVWPISAGLLLLVACAPEPPPGPPPSPDTLAVEPPASAMKPVERPKSGQVVPEASRDQADPVVHIGLAATHGEPRATTIATNKAGDITLNFANADIREVVAAILGRTLGVNYDIDPKVQGTVTLQTNQPLTREAVLPALEHVLAENGVAVVHDDGLYRVVPMASAVRAAPAVQAGNPAGYSVETIPLKYASAAALKKILEPFAPTGGTLQVDANSNALIISGSKPDRDSFVRLISTFDIDSMAGMSFGMYPLKQADAATLARDLDTILRSQGLANTVRVVPIERVNSILLVSAQPKAIDRAHDWLTRLEQGPDEASAQLYVYFVQNSRATDLAKVLGQLFVTGVASNALSTAPGSAMARLTAPPSSAMPTSTTPGAPPQPAGNAAAASANPPPPNGDTDASAPSEAEDVTPNSGDSSKPPVHIVADERNNALVIRCRPADYRLIEAALKRLDVLSQQILIEATVAEVTLNKNLNYGLQWFFQHGAMQTTLSQTATAAIAQAFPGFNFMVAGANAQTILTALSAVTSINVVSAPQLMVLDHHTATLEVGDSVPIATQQAVSVQTPGAPIVSTIQQQDTGVILQVTPRINNNGTATLDIDQEVSQAIQTTSSNINSPTISKRKISTEVAVADGQTIALGGMIQDQKTKTRDGLPVLADLPVVGSLFSATTNQHQRTELLILLTPRIIHDQAEARDVTDELRQRLSPVSAASRP